MEQRMVWRPWRGEIDLIRKENTANADRQDILKKKKQNHQAKVWASGNEGGYMVKVDRL